MVGPPDLRAQVNAVDDHLASPSQVSDQPVDVSDLFDFGAEGALVPLRSSWLKMIKRHVPPALLVHKTPSHSRQRGAASSVLSRKAPCCAVVMAFTPSSGEHAVEFTRVFDIGRDADAVVDAREGGCRGRAEATARRSIPVSTARPAARLRRGVPIAGACYLDRRAWMLDEQRIHRRL